MTVFWFWPFAAIQADSAIDGMSALFAGPSFKYAFKGNADAPPPRVHHPAADAFTFIVSITGNDHINDLTKQKFGSGFNKSATATDIFNDASIFLIVISDNYGFEEGFAGIASRVLLVFNTIGPHDWLRKFCLRVLFCDRSHAPILLLCLRSDPH